MMAEIESHRLEKNPTECLARPMRRCYLRLNGSWGMPQKRGNMINAQATIIGNVTNDPELKYIASGAALLRFTVASNHYWTDGDGEKKESTMFVDCTAWRFTAEDSANVLEKGVGVMVVGRLEEQSWEDKETGAKRSKICLIADNVAILTRSIESFERKRRSNNEGGSASPAKKAVSPRQAQQRQSVPTIQDTEEPF